MLMAGYAPALMVYLITCPSHKWLLTWTRYQVFCILLHMHPRLQTSLHRLESQIVAFASYLRAYVIRMAIEKGCQKCSEPGFSLLPSSLSLSQSQPKIATIFWQLWLSPSLQSFVWCGEGLNRRFWLVWNWHRHCWCLLSSRELIPCAFRQAIMTTWLSQTLWSSTMTFRSVAHSRKGR